MKIKKMLIASLGILATCVISACGGGGEASDVIALKIGVSTGDNDPRNISAQMFADEINEPALSKIFYWISQAFYKSDEYNWKEYRFLDVREYRQCVKQRKSAE